MRRPWQHLYATPQWRALRAAILLNNPLCSRCDNPSTVADHIIPHKGDVSLFFKPSNLSGMCAPCHNRKTRTEDM